MKLLCKDRCTHLKQCLIERPFLTNNLKRTGRCSHKKITLVKKDKSTFHIVYCHICVAFINNEKNQQRKFTQQSKHAMNPLLVSKYKNIKRSSTSRTTKITTTRLWHHSDHQHVDDYGYTLTLQVVQLLLIWSQLKNELNVQTSAHLYPVQWLASLI